MDLRRTVVQEPEGWDALLSQLSDGHLLQSWEWGQFKERYGWEASYLSWKNSERQIKALALLLKRSIGPGFSVLYCPRGPLLDWTDEALSSYILAELTSYAKSVNAIFIKIDPHLALGMGKPESSEENSNEIGLSLEKKLPSSGWRFSSEQIQFRNTMILHLTGTEEDLLRGMKQKTRYNIRLAARRGVSIRKGGSEDLDLLYQMYAETAVRDGFTIRDPAYYQDAWASFFNANLAQPFIAEVEGDPVAGIIVFRFGSVATYMYGMSRSLHREKMPNHLLQWEAIKWAKSKGCTTYDFWGAPDDLTEEDRMWGVYRFKGGFGAEFTRLIGAWDFPARPILYNLYKVILPKILGIMRTLGRRQTRSTLDQ